MIVSRSGDVTRIDAPCGPSWRIYLAVLVAAAAIYLATAQRGPAWQDSGMHQWRVAAGELTNPFGLALSHPLYIVVGQAAKLAGRDGFFWAINAMSGLAMAIALANLYLLGYWLSGRHLAGVLAAALLGVGHAPWWLATIAESYTWVVALLSTELVLLVWLLVLPAWWKLALLGLVSGLGFSLHNFALLPLPVYGLAALLMARRREIPWLAVAAFVAAWLVGSSLYLVLIIRQGLASGDWADTARSALFGSMWQEAVIQGRADRLFDGLTYLLLNWPWLALMPVLIGWWAMPHRVGRRIGLPLGAIAAIELIFAIRYDVPDQWMFLLPSHLLLAVGAAVGIGWILERRRRTRRALLGLVIASIVATPFLYGLLPVALDRMGRTIRPGRSMPFRNEDRYWLTPWKHNEDSAGHFARAALDVAAPDGVITAIGGSTVLWPLRLTQWAGGGHPGVEVDISAHLAEHGREMQSGRLEQLWRQNRPVFVAASEPIQTPTGWQPREPAGRRSWPLVPIAPESAAGP